MSVVEYDSGIIQAYAEHMYDWANWIVFVHTIAGLAIGAGVGWGVSQGNASGGVAGSSANTYMHIGAVVGGAIGYALGQGKTFWYRLAAQMALCMERIEANTRPAGGATRAASLRHNAQATVPNTDSFSEDPALSPPSADEEENGQDISELSDWLDEWIIRHLQNVHSHPLLDEAQTIQTSVAELVAAGGNVNLHQATTMLRRFRQAVSRQKRT